MKRNQGFLFLFALLLPVSSALAQNADSQTSNDLPRPIVIARCAYTQADAVCASVHAPGENPSGPSGDATLAQIPRRVPGPPFRARRPPMGGPAYPSMWQSQPSVGHALIGAVIGFGIGVAIGAKGNAGARATLGIATVGAGLGAAMCLAIPSFPSPNPYRRRWPQNGGDEEATDSKPDKSKVAASRPDSSQVPSPTSSSTSAEDPLPAAGAPVNNSISTP
jgi:hypothetical protein